MAAGGIPIAVITLLIVILAQVARIGTDLWLSWWSSKNFKELPDNMYLIVYIIWGVLQIVITLLSGVLFAYACALAARRLHDRALKKVFRAPMSYFDTTPLGRILNRFSKDVDNLDSMIPETSRMFFYTFGLVFGTTILIGAVFPYFFLALVPATAFYMWLQNYYR
jgi:ABC-type multidrug transport system fused ATPase/permease subunit